MDDILSRLDQYLKGENSTNGAVDYIQANKHNHITTTYYLLLKKEEREKGKNLFYEFVT